MFSILINLTFTGIQMTSLQLTIYPNEETTLNVLGVTPSQIVLAGQDGKTQSFEIDAIPELKKAVAGDIVTVGKSDTANEYIVLRVTTPAALKKAAQSTARPCNMRVEAHLRNDA